MEQNFKHHVTLHKDGTYSLGVSIDLGYMKPDDLIYLGTLAKEFNVNCLMATTAKKINFMDVKAEDVNAVWDKLDEHFGDRLGYPQGKIIACPGNNFCKFAAAGRDNKYIAKEIEKISLRHSAGKIKVGVTCCPISCAMPKVRDLGVIGTLSGWMITIGGNGAGNARVGDLVAKDLSDEELLAMLDKIYQYFEENKNGKERTARTITRLGVDSLKTYLNLN